jgi:hypothetical protein
MSEADWKDAVLESMRAAVERRRVADVPVGVLLSGGIDSSLIVALLAESGHKDLKTFSIGFESVGDIEGDEFKYSDIVAERFGTDHQQIRIESSRMIDALPGAIEAMSEPMVSHDTVAFYLLSQEVSKHVKVIQSGQGADEVFGGYHWYPAMMRTNDPVGQYAEVYFDRDHEEMAEVVSPELMNGDASREFVEDYFAHSSAAKAIDKTFELDQKVMMVDDPVKRVDNMTMAYGLEARVPFIDHELVELAARIPADLKVRDGGKYVLKEAAREVVPDEIIDRKKGYFPVPALKYLCSWIPRIPTGWISHLSRLAAPPARLLHAPADEPGRRRRGEPHLPRAPHGARSRRVLLGPPRQPHHHLVAEDEVTGTIDRHGDRRGSHARLRRPRARLVAVVPGRRSAGGAALASARRWCAPRGAFPGARRAFMDLSVMHDNARPSTFTRSSASPRAVFTVKRKNAINEKLFTGAPPEEELNPYARIIVDEARRRGIGVEVIDAEGGFLPPHLRRTLDRLPREPLGAHHRRSP